MDTIKGYFSIDIGFGDKIVDGPFEMEFPVLLDFPVPRIIVYSLESVIAEKFEAVVKLNFLTSRMKDFYDILFIVNRTEFNKNILREALSVTFRNRETNIEDRNLIYDQSFKFNSQKQIQWTSFLTRNKLTSENNFSAVIDKINLFIEPIFLNDNKLWNPNKFLWE